MPQDRQARFEALASAVGEPLRRYVRRRIDHETAQDVVAEAFLVIWRRLDDVPSGHELAWCYSVARLCLNNARRAQRRHASLLRRIASAESTIEPRLWESDRDPDPGLHAAMRSLETADRELLRLWAWEDLGPADIAVVLGISANAASIRLHRARKRLATILAGNDGKATQDAGHKPIDEGRSV